MPDESIYSDNRLAQPDEVWNFGLGDGLEKAFALMNYMRFVAPDRPVRLETNGAEAIVAQDDEKIYRFSSVKKLKRKIMVQVDDIEEYYE